MTTATIRFLHRASVVPALRLDHLRALEAESIHILREVPAEFERPAMLRSTRAPSTPPSAAHGATRSDRARRVDFSRDVFEDVRDDFETLLQGARCHAIPLSALYGDNVISRSARTPWFDGPPLLEYLETVGVTRDVTARPSRFPVQLVVRPHDRFRGYAGQIAERLAQLARCAGSDTEAIEAVARALEEMLT
jgi:hypothetical protein